MGDESPLAGTEKTMVDASVYYGQYPSIQAARCLEAGRISGRFSLRGESLRGGYWGADHPDFWIGTSENASSPTLVNRGARYHAKKPHEGGTPWLRSTRPGGSWASLTTGVSRRGRASRGGSGTLMSGGYSSRRAMGGGTVSTSTSWLACSVLSSVLDSGNRTSENTPSGAWVNTRLVVRRESPLSPGPIA